ncbi:MAG TPA: hypothetical protein VI564_02035 [Candidatus Nanoarchaeia archaeon]|nr:hypothetical protein [Candidatus Nanoarchaeia archaeon]
MTTEDQECISQLLPYDLESKKKKNILTGLIEYRALVEAGLRAIRSFQTFGLEKFDSLVGENACQIRAVWIAMKAGKGLRNLDGLCRRVQFVLERIDALLELKLIDSKVHRNGSLQTIIDSEALKVPLTQEEKFLILSFLLSEMKSTRKTSENSSSIYLTEIAEPKHFQRYGDVSVTFARNLISKLRKKLAKASVSFIRENSPTDYEMVSDQFTFNHNDLPCIPLFWSCKTALNTAQSARLPFVLYAKFLSKSPLGLNVVLEECLFFKPTAEGLYIKALPQLSDLNQPACIFQGIVTENSEGALLKKSEWKARIQEHGLFNVILAGAADHRQYPDSALDAHITALNNPEYNSYKTLAKNAGFSADNPTTFFIQHVYASTPGKILAEIEQRKQSPVTQNPIGNLESIHFLRHAHAGIGGS